MVQQSPGRSLHFLCVGADPQIVSYLLTATNSNLSLDSCNSIQDAHEKVAASSYDVYIINFALSETLVLDLIEEIRSKEKKKITVAVIITAAQESVYAKILKEKKGVDILLHTPMDPKQIEDLLATVQSSSETSPPSESASKSTDDFDEASTYTSKPFPIKLTICPS